MAAEPVLVFDSCAIIALLRHEPGAETVASLLEEESRCRVHAIQVCEVFYDGLRRGGRVDAPVLEDLLTESGFEIESSVPTSLWQAAGKLKADLRRVSLADCFAVAMALQENAILVTSDHHEFDPLAAAGVCPIRFIR